MLANKGEEVVLTQKNSSPEIYAGQETEKKGGG